MNREEFVAWLPAAILELENECRKVSEDKFQEVRMSNMKQLEGKGIAEKLMAEIWGMSHASVFEKVA